jgi:hypothetical protein
MAAADGRIHERPASDQRPHAAVIDPGTDVRHPADLALGCTRIIPKRGAGRVSSFSDLAAADDFARLIAASIPPYTNRNAWQLS